MLNVAAPLALHELSNPSCLQLSGPSLRHLLRQATAEVHASLDAQIGGCQLQSLPGYRWFLEVNAAGLIPLEAALVAAGVEQVFPDWERRSRRAAILGDLAQVAGS